MDNEKISGLRAELEKAIDETLEENIVELIRFLKRVRLLALSKQLESAKHSPDLIRELFQIWVMRPEGEIDSRSVTAARKHLGWNVNSSSFNGIRPEFLDVIFLLPPRRAAVIETLLPLLEHQRKEKRTSPESIKVKKLLDIGTGTGILMRILRKVGIMGEMLGIDPARKLADYALNKFRDAPDVAVEFKKIEDFRLQSEQKFQMALCYMVLHHVPYYKKALKNIFDALVEGGLLVYTDKLYAEVPKNGRPQEINFKTANEQLLLKSGQEFEIQPANLTSVRPFKPHPERIKEYDREWKIAAETLSKTGFLIQCAKPLNERVVLFVCRKPHSDIWNKFATENVQGFRTALNETAQLALKEPHHPPYHFTLKILETLYEAITGEVCPKTSNEVGKGFLRGIAYFSWEKASRLFLVRRAVPFDFHILSYSHVHEGWGSLGRMLVEFEEEPVKYVEKIGYSCLTRDAVQRTLPFQGDIKNLKYEAAMAVPIYRTDRVNGHQLRGAVLFYLAKPEHVPLHTGSPWQNRLIKKFEILNVEMNTALNLQEKNLKIINSATAIRNKWKKLAREKSEVVIAQLGITAKSAKSRKVDPLTFSDVCSKIQAQLSGSECFSVLDDREIKKGQAAIFVAARFDLSYDEIREKILTAVGAAAEDYGPIRYKCTRLGHESSVN